MDDNRYIKNPEGYQPGTIPPRGVTESEGYQPGTIPPRGATESEGYQPQQLNLKNIDKSVIDEIDAIKNSFESASQSIETDAGIPNSKTSQTRGI